MSNVQLGQSQDRGIYLAPNGGPFLNHPWQGFAGVGMTMVHLYNFDTLSAGPIDREVDSILVPDFPLPPAKGLVLSRYFFVKRKVNAKDTAPGCHPNPSQM